MRDNIVHGKAALLPNSLSDHSRKSDSKLRDRNRCLCYLWEVVEYAL